MVERDGVAFGPYSFEELQQKVTANEFALTDRACDCEGGVWLPISKLFAGHTGNMAVITSGKVDASSIFASLKRIFTRSDDAK